MCENEVDILLCSQAYCIIRNQEKIDDMKILVWECKVEIKVRILGADSFVDNLSSWAHDGGEIDNTVSNKEVLYFYIKKKI